MMKAKNYLLQIKQLDRKIENKQMEIQSLYELVQSITATPKEINVQTNSSQDRMGDAMARIIDLQDELNNDIDRYVDMKLEAIRLLNEIEEPEHANILIRRYVNYEEWQDIADLMGCSRQWLDKMHGKALREFQEILDNSLQKFT